MSPTIRPSYVRYAAAILSVALAALVRQAFDDTLKERVPFITFFVAVVFTAWYGGLGSSLLALALSALASIFFIPPRGSLSITDTQGWLSLILFLFVGGVLVLLSESLRRARFRAESLVLEADQQRERLRTTLASIGDAVLVTDDRGRVTLLNAVAESLIGWKPTEAIGRPLEEVFVIVNEQTRQPVESPVPRVLRQGVVVGLGNHTLLIDRKGTSRPIDDSAAPVRDEQGAILGAVLVFRDVGPRRRAEQVSRFLAEASATLAALVDYQSTLEKVARLAVPFFADWCAVDMAEPDGSLRRLAVAHVDPARVRFAHELQQRYPPPADSETGTRRVLRSGQPEMVTDITEEMLVAAARDEEHLRLIRQLGLRSYLCAPLKIRGKVLGVLTFATAESGRLFTRDDLALAEDLAHRAAVAVENARLFSEIKETDRRKDEFLAMLAHELRNPLAPIQNALYILEGDEGDREAFDFAREVISRQVHHLVRLVDDLLDISRIMRGKVELRKEKVELSSVVARAVETARPALDAQQHQLTVTLPSEPVQLDADPVRLAQVLGNLLNNSAKYTPERGHVWLSAEVEGEGVVLRVRDTGIGIPAPMLPRIFDLFTQVNASSRGGPGGLGIGLTLVKSLVEMHDGRVQAFSAGPGQGSEFIVRLPILPAEPPKPAPTQAIRPSRSSSTARRVLIVDDNIDAANSLALMLRLQGHEVRVVHEGPAALAVAGEFGPDVGVLDIGMPGMDGYELARRLRDLPDLRGVLLIALTGWGQEEFRRRSKEAGFDHHLVKPADPRTLRDLLTPRNDQ